MSAILQIRQRLGMTQQQFADAIGVTQGNVSNYENRGQTMPPETARRLISAGAERGIRISFDDIYTTKADSPTSEAA